MRETDREGYNRHEEMAIHIHKRERDVGDYDDDEKQIMSVSRDEEDDDVK